MLEGLTAGCQLLQFRAAALGEDGVAGIAIVGFDGPAILGLVVAIVAAETARPDHVAEVVRVNAPAGLHFWKKVFLANVPGFRDPPCLTRFFYNVPS